jgi:hypothetical protein
MSEGFRGNKPWSLAEDDLLQILMAEEKKARTIAACCQRSTRAIRRRAERPELSWRNARIGNDLDAHQTSVADG